MNGRDTYPCKFISGALVGAAIFLLLVAPCALAQRTQLKPGRPNIFSAQQDIEMGQQVAQDAEKQLQMLNNRQVDDYLNRLGKKLAVVAPGAKYPYQFKCVNDSTINAFALPGGFLFINRGTIEAADNEAELAGVISHEIGHVALRHGTKQATKSYILQMPLAIFGGLGGESTGAALAKIGGGFLANTVLLKYSRDDERQADLMGAQILYDNNYNPQYMAQFFEKLGSKGGTEFFSSHPNPENRIKNINTEIEKLGSISSQTLDDSREFKNIQRLVKSLPPAPKASANASQPRDSGKAGRPQRPSDQFKDFDGDNVSLSYPDNWKAYGNQQEAMLAPDGGIIGTGNNSALAYGVMMAVYAPSSNSTGLNTATRELVASLQKSNSSMRVVKDQASIRIGGKTAQWITLSNDSPIGGKETNWLAAVLRPEGLVYFVFVAPEQEFADYQEAFRKILNSVSFISR